MRRLLVVLIAAGCASGGGDRGATIDASGHGADASSSGGGDGTGSDGGFGSGNSGDDAGGSGSGNQGSDGGVATGCPAPAPPSVTMSVLSSSGGPGLVFRAGDQILAKPVIDQAHAWLRWTGSGWSSEPIPWPSNLPTNHNHYISRVVQLATTRALIVTDDRWMMTYDGTTMSPAIQPPSSAGLHIWGYTQDAGGAYHVFWGTQEWISKPDGTWYPPAPIPIPLQSQAPDDVIGAAAIMRSGRIVVAYLDANFNAPARHAHLLSRGPNEPWTNAIDLTPQWAVNAQTPQLYAPPGGGIAINVTGASNYYLVPALWRSADGITVGDYETITNGTMRSFAGECLDSLIVNGTSQGNYALFERQGYSWIPFASHSATSVLPDQIAVAALANGKTFWALGTYTGTDYLVSP